MGNKSVFLEVTQLITQDKKFSFTLISYASIMTIFLNLNTVQSPVIGVAASILYLLITATFMGQALFKNENLFTKFLLGNLLVIVAIGLVGWIVLIIYNLDNIRTAIVLLIVTTLASILNQRIRNRNAAE